MSNEGDTKDYCPLASPTVKWHISTYNENKMETNRFFHVEMTEKKTQTNITRWTERQIVIAVNQSKGEKVRELVHIKQIKQRN